MEVKIQIVNADELGPAIQEEKNAGKRILAVSPHKWITPKGTTKEFIVTQYVVISQ